MKTKFNWICDDWKRAKNHCRTTVNKKFTDNEPSEEFKKKLLISEHTPIRTLLFDWTWEDIPSFVATHFSRHKFEKYIGTQREDRVGDGIPRSEKHQTDPVTFDGFANTQNIIDAWRKRLCFQASPETRQLAEDFKMTLHEIKPEVAYVLVPNCVYRCGCPEFEMCKQRYFEKFVEFVKSQPESLDIFDIATRYSVYNKLFYSIHECKKEDI